MATAGCLNGSKTFITHGSVGHVMVVMAVTDRSRGAKGISAFVVERGTPGMSAGRKEDKLGMRASDTSEVVFDRLPRARRCTCLVRKGRAIINALQVLDAGRIGIAALAVGLAQGAFEAARDYAIGAPTVRPADRIVPGHPVEARRQRHAD